MGLSEASVECSGAALRRKQILDAARDAFRTHGFHAASMAEVAAGARMSVGQIYRYFDNKEAIVAAIVGEHIEEFVRDLTMLVGEDGSLLDRLLNNFSSCVRRHIDSGFVSLTYEVRAEAARHPDLRDLLIDKDRNLQGRIVDLIKSTDLACLSEESLRIRAEQISILFEGVIARMGRRSDFSPALINTLIRPMLMAILTSKEEDIPFLVVEDSSHRTL